MEAEISHINEKVLVNNLVFGAMGASSRNMDLFSGWLLVGFAAVGGALLANFSQVSQHVTPFALHFFFYAFFVVAILGVIAKALAVIISGACAGSTVGRMEGRDAAESGLPIDFSFVFSELTNIVPWPGRWFVGRSLAKTQQGNLTASTRSFAKVMGGQALCTLAQAIGVICVVGVLAGGLAF
jgi:hypothetical protein